MTNENMKSATATEDELPALEGSPSRSNQMQDEKKNDKNVFRRIAEHPGKAAALILVLIAVVLAGTGFTYRAFLYESTDDAEIDGHIMPLSARIGGQVLQVRVIEGQLVHAGDVLAVIDPKDYKVAQEQAQAQFNASFRSCDA
jgi:membrane fusion protein, multidrug efflux system